MPKGVKWLQQMGKNTSLMTADMFYLFTSGIKTGSRTLFKFTWLFLGMMSGIKYFSFVIFQKMVSFSLLCSHCPCSHFWESVAKESSYLRGLISGNTFEQYLMLEIIQILAHCYCTCVNWDSWSWKFSRLGGYSFGEEFKYSHIRMKPLSKSVYFLEGAEIC